MLFGRKKRELEDKIRALEEKVEDLENELNYKEELIYTLEETAKTGVLCVEELLGRGISYYDFDKLDETQKQGYQIAATQILLNETFQNETNHLLADWVEQIAKRAKDFNEVYGLRMCINALETFRERLDSIPKKQEKKVDEDIYSSI